MRRILFGERRSAIAALGLALTACAGLGEDDVFDEIRGLEIERGGRERLTALSLDPAPDVRRAACDALGRLDGPVDALVARIGDSAPPVRYAAAAALMRSPDPAAADALRPLCEDADPNLRLLAVQGLGRAGAIDDSIALLRLVTGDPEPAVRGAAAISIGRALDGLERDAADRLEGVERALGRQLADEPDPTVAWRIAWALSRFGSCVEPGVIQALERAVGDARPERTARPERWTRVMALRALGRRAAAMADPAAPGLPPILLAAHQDADPQIVLAAVRAIEPLLDDDGPRTDEFARAVLWMEARDPSPAALGRSIEALGAHRCHRLADLLTIGGSLDAGVASREWVAPVDHASATVRAAALIALARCAPDRAVEPCRSRIAGTSVLDRAAAASAARWLSDDTARPILTAALEDLDVRVRSAALRALAGHATSPWLDALVERAAAERDVAMREELGALLLDLPEHRIALARTAFDDSAGDAFAEARKALLAAVVAGAPDDLEDWLRSRLGDPSLAVRRAAARALAGRGATVPAYDEVDRARFPRVGAEVPTDLLATRPVVEVHTARGQFDITLAPSVAPVHVWNFLRLAAAGSYDGTVVHRVVPDFVIQGGSRRGDGYDNTSTWGGRLRDELSPLPFLAGTVGMPKTADPDTGGGQFFVSLVPTPHLDLRYTALGRVTRGLDVAESIEVGDVIERVVVKSR